MSRHISPFSLDLSRPLATADGTIDRRRGYLVGVERPGASGAVRGVGEATPLPGWTEPVEACAAALREPPASWHAVDAGASPGRQETPAARHGYRLAVLDAAARAAAQPLSALLAERAGFPQPGGSVPVNATVGDGTVSETVAAAEAAAEDGFSCLKLKVGARALEADLDRVRAVRSSVDAEIRVDVNGAWDYETAESAVDALASLGVEYVEQPLAADSLPELAELRGRGVGIAVDESVRDCGVDALLDAGAADVAVLKPMALGGPDAAIDAAGELREAGVDPVITTTIDGAVARAGAVHVAAAIPDVRACGLATGGLLASDLGPDPAPVVDGAVAVPDGPGSLGAAFDDRLWD